jgi:hypothetical protein
MVQKINQTIEMLILEKYSNALANSSDIAFTHSLEWGIVKKRLSYLVGSDADKNEVKGTVIRVSYN